MRGAYLKNSFVLCQPLPNFVQAIGRQRQEVEILKDIFKTYFDFDSACQLLSKCKGNTPKDKYSLYIKVNSLVKLRELVLPYMVPSMIYKLGLE